MTAFEDHRVERVDPLPGDAAPPPGAARPAADFETSSAAGPHLHGRPSASTHRETDAEGPMARTGDPQAGAQGVRAGGREGETVAGPAPAPRVLGLDLALTAVGVAPPAGDPYTVHTKPRDGDHRLQRIANALAEACDLGDEQWPDLVVIEDLPTHAHSAGITGMVHGVVRLGLIDARIRYVLVPPASLKKYAAGRGNATKADMRMALYQRAGLDLRDDNQVDAAWLRLMGMDALDHPAVKVPQAHREALAKVAWPEVST